MDIKRGDNVNKTLAVPLSIYKAGMKIYFMAKLAVDDDQTDTRAIIKKILEDTGIEENNSRGVACRIFKLSLKPGATDNIKLDGENKIKLLGEFEIRYTDGRVLSIPNNDKFIKITIYSDIRRGNG